MERDYNQRRSRTWSSFGLSNLTTHLIIAITLLQIIHASTPPQQPYGSPTNDPTNKFHVQRPKFSAKIPAQTFRRKQQTSSSTNTESLADFSGGFPSGFTQGLPTFDFSGPMPAAAASSDSKGGEPQTADTENVGFVNGPPDGFPTLEQLGGKFPGFSSMPRDSPSGVKDNSAYQPPQHRQQFQQQAGSSDYQIQQDEGPEEYLSGPGPSSIHNQVQVGRPGPGPPVRRPRPPKHRPQPHAGSSGHPQFLPARGHPGPTHDYAKRPLVLKVSGKGVLPTKLPPGPPVFYAPSPDVQASSQGYNEPPPRQGESSNHYPQRLRFRRAVMPSTIKDDKLDQVADGSNPETFWEVSSPFILFDTYKSPENLNGEDMSKNVTVLDHDSGEQRFFPSFPAPNPYIGLPYGGPPARPPLFPGPSANRAPSRYHAQFGPTKYNVQSVPPPNRGPSGAYSSSSENHDHDRYQDNNLLGSGNFEVIRGGTYYEDDDAYAGFHGGGNDHGAGHNEDGDYYHHNGHSSPPGYRAPGTDFFANFRDFADINPPSRSYSHRHETLAAPPAGIKQRQPKNILEKLESSLDSQQSTRHVSSLSRESDPMMATF